MEKDEIVSIEYIGEGETADIEIVDAEGEYQQNYFLANGLNVHNSGAMANYPAYKSGLVKKKGSEHEIIEKWTKSTYGLIIYQEQVMQIVRELGDFDWAQTNTVRKVMSKSGGAEYFMKNFWPPWKKGCMDKGMNEKQALKAFHRIMSFGCLSGDTLIMNPYPNQNAKKWVSIKDLYEWDGYASPLAKGAKKAAYVKMQSYSLSKGGRLKPNRIAKVFCNGKKDLWEIVTKSGKKIKASKEHRFITKRDMDDKPGFIKVKDLYRGYEIAFDGGYSKETYNMDFVKNVSGKRYDIKEIAVFRVDMMGKPCDVCKRTFKDDGMEVHHITYSSPNSRMMWCCNECHKVLEYRKQGRTKKDTKGHKIIWDKIVSITLIGFEDVYDIEMEDRTRPTYIANGFVSHNSWAFNLSHSVSYALVSYFCMWFKHHYSVEYITAYLNTVKDTDGTKIKSMIKETERLQLIIREADVNVSKHDFVIDGGDIVSGLSNVKNVGDKAVATIVENQPFKGILDFLNKIDNRACNKRSVENLIRSGAFDIFNYNKKKLIDHLEVIQKNVKKKSEKGIKIARECLKECKGEEEFSEQEIAQMKADTSPVNVGKHLSEYYSDVEKKMGSHIKITNLIDIELDEGEQQKDRTQAKKIDVWVRGVMTSVDLKRLSQEVKEVIDSKAEQRYALCNLEDNTDFIVLSFKGDIYQRYEQKLHSWKGKVLLIRGSVNLGWKKIFVDKVYVMDKIRGYIDRDYESNYKPSYFHYSYLLQHPLKRMFKSLKGIKGVKSKLGCKDLKNVYKLSRGKSMWALGIIVDIQNFTIKRGQHRGKKFYWCFFEDETFQGSFMIFPGDKRFKQMKADLLELGETKAPVMLKVQKDMKFKPEDVQFKQVSISIDKRKPWKDMIKKIKFKRK